MGDVELAIDIYKQDAKINPGKEEIAPGLPSRPRPSTTQAQSTTSTGAVSSTSDWWSNPGSTAGSTTVSSMPTGIQAATPQIYQYTDPVTGQVSYVDSNGQEYLDPNNPQHQQQLMGMTNPQLIAQPTNNDVTTVSRGTAADTAVLSSTKWFDAAITDGIESTWIRLCATASTASSTAIHWFWPTWSTSVHRVWATTTDWILQPTGLSLKKQRLCILRIGFIYL